MDNESTAIATIKMQDLSPAYAEIMVLGKVLQLSGYFTDVRDQAQAVTKILYGRELGFSPIVSMSGIHIIEGKPALSSNLMASMIKRSGKYDYRVREWNDQKCALMFLQKVGEVWEELGISEFTIADAQRAKVKFKSANGHDTVWTKFPKSMLFARALSQGERVYCPDVSSCALYVAEELGAIVTEAGEVVELPASRSNGVERTTTEEPLPARGQWAKDAPTVDDMVGALSTEQANHETNSGPAQSGGAEVATSKGQAEAPKSRTRTTKPKPPVTGDPNDPVFCDKPRQDFLRIEFERLLRDELKPKSDALRKDWLKFKGFVNEKGEGTSTRIPMDSFKTVCAEALNHAKSL